MNSEVRWDDNIPVLHNPMFLPLIQRIRNRLIHESDLRLSDVVALVGIIGIEQVVDERDGVVRTVCSKADVY